MHTIHTSHTHVHAHAYIYTPGTSHTYTHHIYTHHIYHTHTYIHITHMHRYTYHIHTSYTHTSHTHHKHNIYACTHTHAHTHIILAPSRDWTQVLVGVSVVRRPLFLTPAGLWASPLPKWKAQGTDRKGIGLITGPSRAWAGQPRLSLSPAHPLSCVPGSAGHAASRTWCPFGLNYLAGPWALKWPQRRPGGYFSLTCHHLFSWAAGLWPGHF